MIYFESHMDFSLPCKCNPPIKLECRVRKNEKTKGLEYFTCWDPRATMLTSSSMLASSLLVKRESLLHRHQAPSSTSLGSGNNEGKQRAIAELLESNKSTCVIWDGLAFDVAIVSMCASTFIHPGRDSANDSSFCVQRRACT